MLKGKKVLHLSLYKEAFEVMVTGEKTEEYREPSKWIKSRLLNKDGSFRDYDYVKFVNGYGKNKPYFITKFLGCSQFEPKVGEFKNYSNGLEVSVLNKDYIIYLGEIYEKGNLKQ